MKRVRVIPVLLIQNSGLVKSVQFKSHQYVGDPINAVKIFNEKEVDEIVILDISASGHTRGPNLSQIKQITEEAFMPLAYGGGITLLSEIKEILYNGAEKVVLNTSAIDQPELIREAAKQFGTQSIVVSIDVGKCWRGGYKVYRGGGKKKTKLNPIELSLKLETLGAGEIILTRIQQDGTFDGYDYALIKAITEAVKIPVIANGGAGSIDDFRRAVVESGASAVAAGSFFVYQQPLRAVLISYPDQEKLIKEFFSYVN